MAKKDNAFLGFVMWLVGVLVSLAVGFGMTSGTLSIPYIPTIIVAVAGWIVIVGTLLGVILAIVKLAQ